MRRDLRVIFKEGAEPGLETEGSGFRIGFCIRGRVYCIYDRRLWLVGLVVSWDESQGGTERLYRTLYFKGFGVDDMIGLEFDGAGIEC